MRDLPADCWSESFGCGGLTLASELGQSQLPDVLQKPASKGNSSNIATPRKQCQTQISSALPRPDRGKRLSTLAKGAERYFEKVSLLFSTIRILHSLFFGNNS